LNDNAGKHVDEKANEDDNQHDRASRDASSYDNNSRSARQASGGVREGQGICRNNVDRGAVRQSNSDITAGGDSSLGAVTSDVDNGRPRGSTSIAVVSVIVSESEAAISATSESSDDDGLGLAAARAAGKPPEVHSWHTPAVLAPAQFEGNPEPSAKGQGAEMAWQTANSNVSACWFLSTVVVEMDAGPARVVRSNA